MNADHRSSLHTALLPALLGAFLAGAAITGVAFSFLSTPPGATPEVEVGAPVTITAPAEPMPEAPTEDCGLDQVAEPGEYESIERTGSTSATWVIVPESYQEMHRRPSTC